jgi:hypothetical protein
MGGIFGGGGGSSAPAPAPVTQNVSNTNIPSYAQPYVENMLGQAAALTDINQNPYQTYGGQRIADFSPQQQAAFNRVANQQTAGQVDTGTNLSTAAGLGSLNSANQAGGYGKLGSGYGSLAAGMAPQAQGYGAMGANYGAGATNLGLSAADMARQQGLSYGAMGAGYGAQAAGLAPQAQQYGQNMADIGAAGGMQANALSGNVANQAMDYGQQAARSGNIGLAAGRNMANIGAAGLGYGAQGMNAGQQAAGYGAQGANIGQSVAGMSTDPGAQQAYMSPYIQNALQPQLQEMQRQYGITGQQQKSQAVGAGAFGGTRDALMRSENERNKNMAMNQAIGSGYQNAFTAAQNQMNQAAQLGMQGTQQGITGQQAAMQGANVGLAGISSALQGQQGQLAGVNSYQQGLQGAQQGLGNALSSGNLGLAGTQQALAGQQGALSGLGQASNLYGQGMQGAQAGLQGLQGALAGTSQGLQGYQAGMQGAQTGMQGLQQAGNLYGQGMTGAQVGLQGVGAQQAGYAGANQAGGTLGQLGQTQFGQQQAITRDQLTAGAVQQAQAQQALDQQYQDFMKQKNYPYQQLAFMGDMTRGLPLSQTANAMYSAPANAASQLGGLGMSALGIYGMSGGFKQAKGGVVHAATGGLMAAKAYKDGGYAIGGDISMLNVKQLQEMLDNPTLTPMEVEMIEKRIMLLTRMQNNPQSDEIMAPAQGQQMPQRSGIGAIGTGNMVPEEGMAGGGIVAFAAGGQNKESYQTFLENQVRKSIEDQLGENSFAKSDAEKAKLEASIGERKERSPYEALAMAGLQTMAGTSPYALTNLGLGASEGLKSYSKSAASEAADRQKLFEQQVYADKAEQARKAGLTGQMQTTLGQMYNKQAAQAVAGAGSEEKALLRVQALINQDDQLPLLYKQRDMYEPNDPKYKAYNDAINSIKKTYFEQAGIKRPYVAPAGVQLPEEVKEPGFLERIFGSSKPAASKSPGVMKFDKNGNPV